MKIPSFSLAAAIALLPLLSSLPVYVHYQHVADGIESAKHCDRRRWTYCDRAATMVNIGISNRSL